MNRKTIIILLAVLVVAIVGVGVILYLQSFKTVRFDFKKSDVFINVYRKDGKEDVKVASLDKTGELRLQSGKYFALPEGKGYEIASIPFEVKDKDIPITIDPALSMERLSTMLTAELPAIQSVLTSKYASVIPGFTLDRGELLKQGEWYITTLTQKTETQSEEGDVYRTVLKKAKNVWVIKAKPALIVSAKDYPDIPIDILYRLNAK
jgi:hypothetical protein